MRVLTHFVRRIVWQARPRQAFAPGTLVYRDGRSVRFRSLRFGQREVSLLSGGKLRRVPFNKIAELHLPKQEYWESYFDELAILAPEAKSRLVQLETTDGIVVTASLARFRASVNGIAATPTTMSMG